MTRPTTLAAAEGRFAEKWDLMPDGCWQWRSIVDGNEGYGYFSVGNKRYRAHRWAYEHAVAPIPDGLHLDHLCRNRACVNPDHLEPVTPRENSRRSPIIYAETCAKGHPYELGSYYMDRGARACKVCKRQQVRESSERRSRNSARYVCPECGEERSLPHRAAHMRTHGGAA